MVATTSIPNRVRITSLIAYSAVFTSHAITHHIPENTSFTHSSILVVSPLRMPHQTRNEPEIIVRYPSNTTFIHSNAVENTHFTAFQSIVATFVISSPYSCQNCLILVRPSLNTFVIASTHHFHKSFTTVHRSITESFKPILWLFHIHDIYAQAEAITDLTLSSALIVMSLIPRKFVENAR